MRRDRPDVVSTEGNGDPEQQWLRRIAGGDRSAFEQLYDAYQRRLFAYMFRMLGDRETAAELANDVMFTVWKQAGSFEGKSKVSTWIFSIAHNKAVNALNRDKWRKAEDLEAAGPMPQSQTPADETEQSDVRHHLRAAIAQLSPEHRQVVELAFFEEMSYEEIAQAAGCPPNTVKTRMFHAKKKLQPILANLGLGGGLGRGLGSESRHTTPGDTT